MHQFQIKKINLLNFKLFLGAIRTSQQLRLMNYKNHWKQQWKDLVRNQMKPIK